MVTTSDFPQVLAGYKDLVWPILQGYLKDSVRLPAYCAINPKYQSLLDFQSLLISDYPQRKGKYLRPSLVMLSAQAMGLDSHDVSLLAAAMQLSEEWILIHDDIEDESLERRGLPTLSKIYGIPLALNAGDSLHVIMWKMILDLNNPRVSQEFYNLLNRTTFGQTIDIKWNQDNKLDISDEDVFLILESKTCYYTISGPMRLGAILAGASEDQLNQLYNFGIYLGRAFQIIDDVLDLTSDFAGLKKQLFNDLYEGKRTIILSHLLSVVTPAEMQILKSILAKPRLLKTEAEVLQIMDLIHKYHSLDYSKQMALDFAQKAREILDHDLTFLKAEPYRHQISQAIDFIVNRLY